MPSISSSVEIEAPAEVVFEALLDTSRWREWFWYVEDVRVEPPGPIAAGSLVQIVYRVGTGGAKDASATISDCIVVDLDPPRLLACETIYLMFHLEIRWEVAVVTAGRSRLRYVQLFRNVRLWEWPLVWLLYLATLPMWWSTLGRPLRLIRGSIEGEGARSTGGGKLG